MSFSGGKRSSSITYSSLVVLLIILSVLHIWVFSDCKVRAIRVLNAKEEVKTETQMKGGMNKISQADLFRKFFNGRVTDLNTTDKGLQEDKRRVPSCPDPLHNK